MTHSSVPWIMSLNRLSQNWGQVQTVFNVCESELFWWVTAYRFAQAGLHRDAYSLVECQPKGQPSDSMNAAIAVLMIELGAMIEAKRLLSLIPEVNRRDKFRVFEAFAHRSIHEGRLGDAFDFAQECSSIKDDATLEVYSNIVLRSATGNTMDESLSWLSSSPKKYPEGEYFAP